MSSYSGISGEPRVFLSRAAKQPFQQLWGLYWGAEISLENAIRIKTEFLFWLRKQQKFLLELWQFNLKVSHFTLNNAWVAKGGASMFWQKVDITLKAKKKIFFLEKPLSLSSQTFTLITNTQDVFFSFKNSFIFTVCISLNVLQWDCFPLHFASKLHSTKEVGPHIENGLNLSFINNHSSQNHFVWIVYCNLSST